MNATSEIIPVPAVNGAVFNPEGQILLTRRSPKVRAPGMWCLPGGHLDGGEDWTRAVRRELWEEVGLTVTRERLLGIYSDPELTIPQTRLENGRFGQFVVAAFYIDAYEGEVTPNDEVDEWGWFALDRLPEPLLRSHPIRIQDAFSFQGKAFVR